jgi:hypothetical protein
MARLINGKWAREEQLTPLESLRKDVPEEIRELCAKMLHVDPAQRLQSASEVDKTLERWQAAQTDSSALDAAAPPPPPPVQTPGSAGSFTPKSGPPPVRKALPKAKLLVAKPLAEGTAENSAPSDSSASIANSSPSVSVDVKKPAVKTKQSDSSEADSVPAFSVDVGKPTPKTKKTTPSEDVPAPAEEPSFSVNVGKPTAKNKKAASSENIPASSEEPSFSINVSKAATKGTKSKSNESLSIAGDESVDEPSLAFDTDNKSSGGKGKSSLKSSAKKKPSKVGGAKSTSKMPQQKILIIAGSAAAVFMVLLLSGVAYLFMSGGKSKTVAKAKADTTEVAPGDETKTDDKKTTEEAPVAAEVKPTPKVEEPAKKDEKPEEPASTDTKKPETPEPLTPTTTADPPPVSAPVTALKPDISTPDPIPEPAKPQPMAVAVNTPATAKPPVTDPFAGFVSEVNLPALGTDSAPGPDALKPLELGMVKIDKKALCIMQLLGNDFAIKGGKQKYAIEAGDGGTSLRDWDIFLREASAESGGAKVAAIGLHDDKLTFTWQQEAIHQKGSPFLCNCILQMSAGPKSHSLALRKVVDKEPFTLDLAKLQPIKASLKLPFPPDPKKVRIRLTVEGAQAKNRFDPKNEIDADKDVTYIAFGVNDTDWVLKMKFDATMKADVQVSITPMYHFVGMPKPETLNTASLKSMPKKGDIDIATQQVNAFKASMGPMPQKAPLPLQQRLAQLEDQLRNLTQSVAQAEQLEGILKSVSSGTKIHYEVIYKTDTKELPLVTTHPPGEKVGKK